MGLSLDELGMTMSPGTVSARVAAVVPGIAARALETERLRRLPEENVRALRDAGAFKLYQPLRFGGFELPYGMLQLEISSLLGAACGATAWVQSLFAAHAWMFGSFGDAALAAVWGERPDAILGTATAAVDGCGRAVPGGVVLDGTWEFASGCEAADWMLVRAAIGPEEARWCAVPRAALEIVDVWYASGLRGSGSHNVVAREVFVPNAMTLDVLAFRGSDVPLYGLPYVGVFQFAICAPALGLAKAALAVFREESSRADRQRSGTRQRRYAEAAAEVDAAEMLLAWDAREFERATGEGRAIAPELRVRLKRNAAYAGVLCRTAVTRLVEVLGAHGIADAHPVQRALRDIAAITSHHGVAWESAAELYGSVAFGVVPSDPMLTEG